MKAVFVLTCAMILSLVALPLLYPADKNSAAAPEPLLTEAAHISPGKIKEAIRFSKEQKLDTTLAFFIDMSIHSGRNRFFVVDLQKQKILHAGLCCHGMGKGSTEQKPVFSNENGSYCTSLGKYRTGKRDYSKWGINVHYKMHGLENSNSNAFKRIVVLHSYDPVEEDEIFPDHLPMGWSQGCPVISNDLMTTIDKLLKNRKKNLLLWVYIK